VPPGIIEYVGINVITNTSFRRTKKRPPESFLDELIQRINYCIVIIHASNIDKNGDMSRGLIKWNAKIEY
jgi:hypothetical protein